MARSATKQRIAQAQNGANHIGDKERRFFDALKNIFVGVPVEGESGYINLMHIKARYFEKVMEPRLRETIDAELQRFPDFREELFDKLYTFFRRYFTESGSIGFFFTPYHQSVYEQVYTNEQDVVLFWKTARLYYVKTDRLFQSMTVEVDGFRFHFDVSELEHKRANEKRELIYAFKERQQDGTIVFTVHYSEKGRKTKIDDIRRAIRDALGLEQYTDAVPTEETLQKAFRIFERQSEVDYFLCKDAKSFLREQFDLWMWQYLLGKPGEEPQTEWTEIRLAQLQALKRIAYRVIDYIAAFEDELVKIWNKPKFVLKSHYVITLDRIAAQPGGMEMLERLWAHPNMEEQLREWRELGMVSEDFTLEDLLLPPSAASNPQQDLFEVAEARDLITNGYHLPYNPDLVERARELRRNMTPAERQLWEYLKHAPYRFLRQRPIDHFIVDFYCPALRLVIEVDGEQHYTEEGKAYDAERDTILQSYGLRVVRFRNEEVLRHFESVRQRIEAVFESPLTPSLSPLVKGGEGAGGAESPLTPSLSPLSKGGEGAGGAESPLTPSLSPLVKGGEGAGGAESPLTPSLSPLRKGGEGAGSRGIQSHGEGAEEAQHMSVESPLTPSLSPLRKGGEGAGSGGIHPRYRYLPIDTKYFPDLELPIVALFDNLDDALDGWLIKSENYQALNTILPKFRERVVVTYIDPPFNLGQSDQFIYHTNYKDATWATLLENRLTLCRRLTSKTGSVFVRCDYNGNWIVRSIMNQVFGQDNFRNEILVGRGASKAGLISQFEKIRSLAVAYDVLYWYSNEKSTRYRPFLVEASERQRTTGKWTAFDKGEAYDRPTMRYEILGVSLQAGQWKWKRSRAEKAVQNYLKYLEVSRETGETLEEYWNRTGRQLEFIRKSETGKIQYWVEPRDTVLVDNNWLDISGYSSTTGFQTENSEYPLMRIIQTISEEKELVMDFFLGSGTTVAVAHKLGRKWLGVEMGEHFYTVVLPRMKRVLFYDKSGVSKEKDVKERYNEQSAGGFFKYYELEQFEDALRRTRYAEDDLFTPPANEDPCQYIFLRDLKMLEALEVNLEQGTVQLDLSKLYENIDLPETLSNLTGKWIRRIYPDPNDRRVPVAVEFADGERVELRSLDWRRIKPLIWW